MKNAQQVATQQLAQKMNLENVRRAGNLLSEYFARFANKIDDSEVNDFFDSRNRDLWTREFARFLEAQIDKDFPSND
jgi:CHASE1-domain containing sensor protein